jgi:hypothetical protein
MTASGRGVARRRGIRLTSAGRRQLLSGAWFWGALALLGTAGCSYDWESLAPRLGADAGAAGQPTGTGGSIITGSGGNPGDGGADPVPPGRTTRGLQVLYTFDEGEGDTIADVSGEGEPLDVTIADTSVVSWGLGSLVLDGDSSGTIATSDGPATKIIAACKESNELTLEAWLAAESTGPGATAPVVTVSQDPDWRNFMLAQTGVAWDVRVRMADTNEAGSPGTSSPTASTQVTHVVYTLDSDGQVLIYANNVGRGPVSRGGDLSEWNDDYGLALANEMTEDAPWAGSLHLVAVYCAALTPEEVEGNFLAGPDPEIE